MNYADLQRFRVEVAEPAMMRLFANTNIPEGFTCIDQLDISFLDGRSCGTDSQIKAAGVQYKDGKAEKYAYEKTDFDLAEFIQDHQNCVFIAGGTLCIYDQLEETEIKSTIRNLDTFALLLRDVPNRDALTIVGDCAEYLKLKHLQREAKNSIDPDNKFLCAGIADDCFFSIQQHDIQSDDPFFSFYVVETTPKAMSPDALEEFLIAHADHGSSVAGSLEQVMDEFQDFMKTGCIQKNAAKQPPLPLRDQIADAQGKTKLSRETPHKTEPEL